MQVPSVSGRLGTAKTRFRPPKRSSWRQSSGTTVEVVVDVVVDVLVDVDVVLVPSTVVVVVVGVVVLVVDDVVVVGGGAWPTVASSRRSSKSRAASSVRYTTDCEPALPTSPGATTLTRFAGSRRRATAPSRTTSSNDA